MEELEQKKGKLLLSLNCRSISDKLDDLKDLIYRLEPLLVVLTETWLDPSHPKGTLSIAGYKHIRKDRTEAFKQKHQKTGGGGIALIYRSDLKVNINIKDEDLSTDEDEIMWATVKVANENHLLGIVYRPEYVNLLQGDPSRLERSLCRAAQLSSRILLVGDLNIDLLKDNEKTSRLRDTCEAVGLESKLVLPTRITENSGTLTMYGLRRIVRLETQGYLRASATTRQHSSSLRRPRNKKRRQ